MALKIPIIKLGSPAGNKLMRQIKDARGARNTEVQAIVAGVLDQVRKRGDQAVCDLTLQFDKVRLTPARMRISESEIALQARKLATPMQQTIRAAARRIRSYHRLQQRSGYSLKTAEGLLQQRIQPLSRVGVYIPGGYTVYPSTVLMDVIPAQLAGVCEIVAVTPPRDQLDPAIAYVLQMLGIREVYRVGGAQAVAALAFGTRRIRPVDKIVGPGNAFVAAAKRAVYGYVDIDSVAGPSEVAIIADTSADPVLVALDLLSQAEHGSGDEIAVCVTEDADHAGAIEAALQEQVRMSPVKKVFDRLGPHALTIFVAPTREASIEFINQLGPEHLQIMTRSAERDCRQIRNASAIFLGSWTPVALGDYFIGTNHVLPTGGAARFASPLGVESFVKRMSVVQVSRSGLAAIGAHVARFARFEGFVHHALSVERRLDR